MAHHLESTGPVVRLTFEGGQRFVRVGTSVLMKEPTGTRSVENLQPGDKVVIDYTDRYITVRTIEILHPDDQVLVAHFTRWTLPLIKLLCRRQ